MESAKGVSVLSLDFRVRQTGTRALAMNGPNSASDCGTSPAVVPITVISVCMSCSVGKDGWSITNWFTGCTARKAWEFSENVPAEGRAAKFGKHARRAPVRMTAGAWISFRINSSPESGSGC
jgi:hypothetical protein